MENMENIGKIKLLELGALPRVESVAVAIGEDGKEIMVMPRIPYEQVLDMMQWCIDFIICDRPFVSEPLKKIIKDCAILKYYTNLDISFIEADRGIDEIYENYDLVDRYGIVDKVRLALDQRQLAFFDETLDATLEAIARYKNSAKGILDVLTTNSTDTAKQLQEALDLFSNEENNQRLAMLANLTNTDVLKDQEEAK